MSKASALANVRCSELVDLGGLPQAMTENVGQGRQLSCSLVRCAAHRYLVDNGGKSAMFGCPAQRLGRFDPLSVSLPKRRTRSLLLPLRLLSEIVGKAMRLHPPFAFMRAVMVLLVALGLLLIGFSHRPLQASVQSEQALYLAEIGLTAADLCTDPVSEDAGFGMRDCPACDLAGSSLPSEPAASLVDFELRAAKAVLVPAQAHVFGRRFDPATPVRAPPLA